jgi:uncharacterized membrane-anchored protein YhcB (DUF1043 family)
MRDPLIKALLRSWEVWLLAIVVAVLSVALNSMLNSGMLAKQLSSQMQEVHTEVRKNSDQLDRMQERQDKHFEVERERGQNPLKP